MRLTLSPSKKKYTKRKRCTEDTLEEESDNMEDKVSNTENEFNFLNKLFRLYKFMNFILFQFYY